MADKDPGSDGPSLELPSFGFGRKKKAATSEPDVAPEAEPAEPQPVTASTPPASEPRPVAREPEPSVERPGPDPQPGVETATTSPVGPTPDTPDPAARREFSLPHLPGVRAALLVGLAVGLLAVLLTFGSLKLCEAVRGTDACGGPGLLLLVATLVVLTYVGSWLLRAFGIDDPGSTSFLAVGLLTVVTILLLLDVIYSRWMVVAVPLVSMAAYALAWWVTTRLVDADQL